MKGKDVGKTFRENCSHAELNFTSPTRIQQQAIPKLLVSEASQNAWQALSDPYIVVQMLPVKPALRG